MFVHLQPHSHSFAYQDMLMIGLKQILKHTSELPSGKEVVQKSG
jgi:hypothetical protein